MSAILAIESSAGICSVAWFESRNCVDVLEEDRANSHAEKLAVFCQELLKKHGRPDAIALNSGPGSYTGLRIGTSLAKGLAYGYQIPVLAISGLEAMAVSYAPYNTTAEYIIPCMDARRMEVYQAVFDRKGHLKESDKPLVVDLLAWSQLEGKKVLIGDGAAKLRELLLPRMDVDIDDSFQPSAKHLLPLAYRKWENREFADLAYFEPFYLKEFIALSPRKG